MARIDELAGELERMGVTEPERAAVWGLSAASDSSVRVPVSLRGERLAVPVGSSSMGA